MAGWVGPASSVGQGETHPLEVPELVEQGVGGVEGVGGKDREELGVGGEKSVGGDDMVCWWGGRDALGRVDWVGPTPPSPLLGEVVDVKRRRGVAEPAGVVVTDPDGEPLPLPPPPAARAAVGVKGVVNVEVG